MKVVINAGYGGFGLSHDAVMEYAKRKGIVLFPHIDDISSKVYGTKATLSNPSTLIHYTTVPWDEFNVVSEKDEEKPIGPGRFEESGKLYFTDRDVKRTDPDLINIINEMGDSANGRCAKLKIVEIPDNIEYEIDEYDGFEHIAERHRIWE